MNDDGTQDPGPPPVLADPVSGLVTGARYDAEQITVRVAEPPKPDIARVREVMAEMLDENSELDLDLVLPRMSTNGAPPAAQAPQARQEAAQSPSTPPIGIPAQQAASPEAAPAPAPEAPPPPRRAPATVVPPARVEKVRRVSRRFALGRLRRGLPKGLPRGLPQRFRRTPKPAVPGRVRKSSAADVSIIMILLFVTAVVTIVLLASLIDTLASVFS